MLGVSGQSFTDGVDQTGIERWINTVLIDLTDSLQEGVLFMGLEDVAAEALALVGRAGAANNLELQIRALAVLSVVAPDVSEWELRSTVNAAFEGMVRNAERSYEGVGGGVYG